MGDVEDHGLVRLDVLVQTTKDVIGVVLDNYQAKFNASSGREYAGKFLKRLTRCGSSRDLILHTLRPLCCDVEAVFTRIKCDVRKHVPSARLRPDDNPACRGKFILALLKMF